MTREKIRKHEIQADACFVLGCHGFIAFMSNICETCGWHKCNESATHCLCSLSEAEQYIARVVEKTTVEHFKRLT